MREEDYETLAINSHWYKILNENVWISKDGTVTKFEDLGIAYILNIINGLQDFKHPLAKEASKKLIAELNYRFKNDECDNSINTIIDILYDKFCIGCKNQDMRKSFKEYLDILKNIYLQNAK